MANLLSLCPESLALPGAPRTNRFCIPTNTINRSAPDAAQADIQDCMALAKEAGASSSEGKTAQGSDRTVAAARSVSAAGAVGGAILGTQDAARMVGAASGATAGIPARAVQTISSQRGLYELCGSVFGDRGYDPTDGNSLRPRVPATTAIVLLI